MSSPAACLAVLAFVLAAAAPAQDDAARVHALFERKCVECHGSELSKPKGKFGFVTDLARMAKDPELIVPGNVDDSELYQVLIDTDPERHMPPEKAREGPLSEDEIELVRRWVAAGAPAPGSTASRTDGATEADPTRATEPSPAPPLGFGARLVRFVGQFHPIIVHFPEALLAVAALLDAWSRLRRTSEWRKTVGFCVFWGAASAVLAGATGWLAAESGPASDTVETHRWCGIATAACALLAAVIERRARRRSPEVAPLAVGIALWATVAIASVTGFFGSSIVRGLDHLAW
jgi:uncharacterized membrane protein/mono/diheme cytochrome c family protein